MHKPWRPWRNLCKHLMLKKVWYNYLMLQKKKSLIHAFGTQEKHRGQHVPKFFIIADKWAVSELFPGWCYIQPDAPGLTVYIEINYRLRAGCRSVGDLGSKDHLQQFVWKSTSWILHACKADGCSISRGRHDKTITGWSPGQTRSINLTSVHVRTAVCGGYNICSAKPKGRLTVFDVGTTFKQHWINASCWLGYHLHVWTRRWPNTG